MATYAAAICMVASFVNRMAAAPGFVVAVAGVLTVFVMYLQKNDGVSWDETTAMVAYGLTIIAAIMIFVEREEEACELS